MANWEQYVEEMAQEFIAIGGEQVREIQGLVERLAITGDTAPETMRTIQHMTHSLKGNGGSFGFPNISLIAHRAEDYLTHVGAGLAPADLMRFYDRMDDVLSGRLPGDGSAESVIAGLPRAYSFDVSDVVRHEIDVVLVMENVTQARLVRREFEACGYSVVMIPNTLEALDYVRRVEPDLVVASALMPGLSGVELMITLKALPATRHIPCALLTSFSSSVPDLEALPADVPVIHKGKEFSDELATALARLKIT